MAFCNFSSHLLAPGTSEEKLARSNVMQPLKGILGGRGLKVGIRWLTGAWVMLRHVFFPAARPTQVTDLLQASAAMVATRSSALAVNLGDQVQQRRSSSPAAELSFTSPLFTPVPLRCWPQLSFRTATYTTDARATLWRRQRKGRSRK